MTHEQRLGLVRAIADRLNARYGAQVKAIGAYGSLARNEDGPYSDIEMLCLLRQPGESRDYEWCAGPWKAEVNVRDEASLRAEAARLEGDWALTHGAFVRILPLQGPEESFIDLRELVLSHAPEEFQAVIEADLIGEIYERIGKVRNASVRKNPQTLPVLAVALAHHTALILGLAHRQLYRTGSSVLDEAAALPELPDGFLPLVKLVTTGELAEAPAVVTACNTLWSGLVRWAAQRGYTLVASSEIPF